jgi:ribosomal protein S18 acetylase RimI-like enzyme
MKIDKVAPREIDCVMSLIADAVKEMEINGIYQWDEIYPDKTVMLADISSNSLYALRPDNCIAGIMAVNEIQSPEYRSIHWSNNKGNPLIVHRLCIHPKFQGQGLAKILMNFAETYARDNNYGSIRLDAFIDNRAAVRLYDSLNYQNKGTVQFRKGSFYCYEKTF